MMQLHSWMVGPAGLLQCTDGFRRAVAARPGNLQLLEQAPTDYVYALDAKKLTCLIEVKLASSLWDSHCGQQQWQ